MDFDINVYSDDASTSTKIVRDLENGIKKSFFQEFHTLIKKSAVIDLVNNNLPEKNVQVSERPATDNVTRRLMYDYFGRL